VGGVDPSGTRTRGVSRSCMCSVGRPNPCCAVWLLVLFTKNVCKTFGTILPFAALRAFLWRELQDVPCIVAVFLLCTAQVPVALALDRHHGKSIVSARLAAAGTFVRCQISGRTK
jgi:hypothetical protein